MALLPSYHAGILLRARVHGGRPLERDSKEERETETPISTCNKANRSLISTFIYEVHLSLHLQSSEVKFPELGRLFVFAIMWAAVRGDGGVAGQTAFSEFFGFPLSSCQ